MAQNHSRPLIEALTGLRFFAAISVAMAHGSIILLIFENGFQISHWLPSAAGIGMPLFFVLSGFVIHYNYSNLITGKKTTNKLRFIWARFSRLYPLFILILLLDILTNSKFISALSDTAESAIQSIRAFPYYIILMQSWLFKVIDQNNLIYQLGQNSPLTWSISTEWFFYMAFLFLATPISYLCRRQNQSRILFILISWVTIYWIVSYTISTQLTAIDQLSTNIFGQIASIKNGFQDSFYRWFVYFSPYARLGEFITGCLVSALFIASTQNPISVKEARWGHLLTWLSLIAVAGSFYLAYANPPIAPMFLKVRNNIAMAPALAALIFCLARYDSPIARFLSWRPLVVLGEASYSIYMVHMLVFVSIRQLSSYVLLPATSTGIAIGTTRYVYALAIIVIISLGSYSFIELPAKNWLRTLWKNDSKIQWRVLSFLVAPFLIAGAFLLFDAYINRAANPNIIITSATYGANCGAPNGNATKHIQFKCRRGLVCDYLIHVKFLGDPAPNCPKDFRVEYRCKGGSGVSPIFVPGEAGLGSRITLRCPRQK